MKNSLIPFCVIENFVLLVSPNSRNAYESMLLCIIFCVPFLFGKGKKPYSVYTDTRGRKSRKTVPFDSLTFVFFLTTVLLGLLFADAIKYLFHAVN